MLNNFGNVVEMKEFIVLHIIFVLSKFINLRLIYILKLNFLDWNCLTFQKLIKIFTFFLKKKTKITWKSLVSIDEPNGVILVSTTFSQFLIFILPIISN